MGNKASSSSGKASDEDGRAVAEAAGEASSGDEAPDALGAATKTSPYQQIVNALIRPPRAVYELRDLGPPEFDFRGRRFVRFDFQLLNPRGLRLCCSWWQPHADDRPLATLPCVIYLHGNAGCRVSARENIEVVLGEGCTYLAFDFAGSGQSDGEWVTLGFHEKDDLAAAMEHLRRSGTVSTVACWGRSMGAATALLHSHRDPSIAGLVLDSAFSDLHRLARELAGHFVNATGYRVPSFLIGAALRWIRSSVLKKSGMDIFELAPIRDVDKAFIPALFCYGEEDDFINPQHTKDLFAVYGGDKNIIGVPGDHNTPRPRFFLDSAAIFLRAVLRIDEEEGAGIALPDPRTLAEVDLLTGAGGGGGAALALGTMGQRVVSPSTSSRALPVRPNYATIEESWFAASLQQEAGERGGARDPRSMREALAARAAEEVAEDELMLQRAIEASLASPSLHRSSGSARGSGGSGSFSAVGGTVSPGRLALGSGSGRAQGLPPAATTYHCEYLVDPPPEVMMTVGRVRSASKASGRHPVGGGASTPAPPSLLPSSAPSFHGPTAAAGSAPSSARQRSGSNSSQMTGGGRSRSSSSSQSQQLLLQSARGGGAGTGAGAQGARSSPSVAADAGGRVTTVWERPRSASGHSVDNSVVFQRKPHPGPEAIQETTRTRGGGVPEAQGSEGSSEGDGGLSQHAQPAGSLRGNQGSSAEEGQTDREDIEANRLMLALSLSVAAESKGGR